MSKAEYNFNQNLLKASLSNSLQEAKKEWVKIFEETRMNKDGLCICQRKNIKYLKYFYNVKTKLTVIVGSSCCTKFNFDVDKIKNKILENILKNNILKREYQVIDNIIEYTNSVEKQLIEYFEKYTLSKNISTLKEATEEIKTLIDDYTLDYLNDIYNTLTNLINLIEKEEEEEEKLKVYSIQIYRRNYISGFGTDIFVDKHKFSSIEKCEDFISKLQIGITNINKYRHENTIECVKILLNNEIIKIFDGRTKTDGRKQLDYGGRVDKDGGTYWYNGYEHIWNLNK
jgi:hypothetical protein